MIYMEVKENLQEFDNREYFSPQRAAEKIGVSVNKLKGWERLGIVRPFSYKSGKRTFRRYTELDISRATLVHLLTTKCHYSMEDALRKLQELS